MRPKPTAPSARTPKDTKETGPSSDGPSPSDRPDLFAYRGLSEFLSAVADHKRRTQSNWSFGVWARQLGLRNVASLTRLITGDRQPGDRLLNVLANYFHFDDLEREYFRFVALLEKAGDDLELRNVIHVKLRELSTARLRSKSEPHVLPVATMPKGQLLSLWGWASPQAVDHVVGHLGLRSVRVVGRALITIVAARYNEASIEPYSEFYIGVNVGSSQFVPGWAGLYFPSLITTSRAVATHGANMGLSYRLGEVTLDDAPTSANASTSIDGKNVATLRMADGGDGGGPTEPVADDTEMYGISATGAEVCRFRMSIRVDGIRRRYDRARDEFWFRKNSSFEKILEPLKFEPSYWVLAKSLSCKMFAAEPV